MQIIGRLLQRNEPVTGTSQRGEWKKMEIIIETVETYPKKVCLICWNERVNEANAFEIGQTLTIDISIESREYNGRYYTDVRAIRFENGVQQQHQQIPSYEQQPVNQNYQQNYQQTYQQNPVQQPYTQQQNYMQQPQSLPDNMYSAVDNGDDLPF